MSTDNDTTERIELPDGTLVAIDVDADRRVIEYRVTCEAFDETSEYDADAARRQAREIREREMASWDTIFPEQVEPVLDVARALERAANEVAE